MMSPLSLNGLWDVRDELLTLDAGMAPVVAERAGGWIPAPVPGDIHQALIAAGRIPEPLTGLNSYQSQWTENRSWWYRRRFTPPRGWKDADAVELEANGLDANAELFLNGMRIGAHRNAFRPFVLDVKPFLKKGTNTLLVRLTAGLENVTDADLDAPYGVRANTEAQNGRPDRGDVRRTFVRKPQYVFGWDWSPRLATTAIGGDVLLRPLKAACIRNVAARPVRNANGEIALAVAVTVEQLHFYRSGEGTVNVTVTAPGGKRKFRAGTRLFLRSGLNYADLEIRIPDAQLWWPAGYGEQPLYTIEAEVETAGTTTTFPAFRYGLRFLELDTDGVFAVKVNGVRIFCRGANWIPADAIYARVTPERYETMVADARAANFTMLRVWGGGLYEPEAFYDACDRHGILVWQDFMFACAPYPDHLAWFRDEVAQEAEFQTRLLQRHACLAVWCGNNEASWAFRDWWKDQTRGGAWIYNRLLPEVCRRNSPEIPYWNGSPYGGADTPNSYAAGDCHDWFEFMMNPDMRKRITPEEYDRCEALFVSEFGYVGACEKATLLEYLGGAAPEPGTPAWHHHTNTFEQGTVAAGIRKHYTDPEGLPLDEYLRYSGLTQGLMYQYALESMRGRENCHGGLFWMYADCWGEVGWTILDYYLRRKPSWYFVRRAFAPVRLILRPAGNHGIRAVVANDTRAARPLELEYGYVSLDGAVRDLKRVRVTAAAAARTEALVFPRGRHDPRNGLWIVRARNAADIGAAVFRAGDYRELRTADPELRVTRAAPLKGGKLELEATAKGYAHAVRLHVPGGAAVSDNYFDLLPGDTRRITVTGLRAGAKLHADAVNAPLRKV